MTVRELIGMLESRDPDAEIVISDSGKAYEIGKVRAGKGVRAYFGADYEALMLCSRGQVGVVWDADELEL